MNEFSKVIEVRWVDVDANRHLRHSAYSDYALEARIAWLKQEDFSLQRFAELSIIPIYFRDETEYYREILLAESVRIDLELAGLSNDRTRWHFRQRFYREDGKLAAKHETMGAWLDLNTRKLAVPPVELTAVLDRLKRSEDFADLPASSKKRE